MIFYAVTK